MSIVAMRRMTLVGLLAHKSEILRRLQALGVAHVEDQGRVAGDEHREYAELLAALDYLMACPLRRRPQHSEPAPELGALLAEIRDNRLRREALQDRLTLLRRHRRELRPWGNFHFPPLEALAGQRLWFYSVPLGQRQAVEAITLPWQIVNRDHRSLYLVVIAAEEPPLEAVPFERSHTGGLSLSEVRAQEDAAHVELERLEAERYLLTHWIFFLASQVARVSNEATLRHAAQGCSDLDTLFVLEAWVPARELAAIARLCEHHDVALHHRPPLAEEEPPILLDNPEWAAGGEEAVGFFQLPGYRSWDPSLMVFYSFSLFFAVILADAGYGLLCALICLAWRFRWQQSRLGRRLSTMGLVMSGAALVYGVLVGSYFGLTPPPGTWLARLHWFDMDDFDAMMTLSIAIGVMHLILANVIAGWVARPRRLALGNLGWVLIIGGGFLLWRASLDEAFVLGDSPWGYIILVGGLLVLAFSSSVPLDGWRHVLQRLGGGLSSLAELSQAFGHALSYMRLFALGLSSASLAVTFNQLAVNVRDGVDGGGTLLFLLILLLGHGLNFVLALMGGVIHGLRLNLIEFLRWGVKGEGRAFKALANREETTWIK
ncbi:V-type ATP synthase subunit I [Halomonas sp. H5]|uniref:V-type ATP synthase subunit I n=1 Tax=Halomonas sp. H5 TaxID=3423910 RepID=UPI003D360E1D